ncbi:hypothetical protein K788_0003693 [Paraburkholderia caribensis MBA4]|uniref:Uncharacterized protein n=1 Tax=Paraburkholderia caribensis MBA4 TaxID=1323664 RepID=A0A0P0R6E0_9BURK|nr:hypothetical protein K788_0003693 [Paraburkholderia caribensis MBA4]
MLRPPNWPTTRCASLQCHSTMARQWCGWWRWTRRAAPLDRRLARRSRVGERAGQAVNSRIPELKQTQHG